jgi:glutathione synthase/RimK-type ligase-like ATP-grasp enzyme
MWILRRKYGITAKALAELCGCRTTRKYIPRRRHFIINYGRDYENAHLNGNVIFDKLQVYQMLQEAGIPQPRIFYKGDTIPNDAFPLLARRKYHSQGRDIIYIHNREDLENNLEDFMYDFLIEYINKTSEYRVHILGDNAFVSVKFGGIDPLVRSYNNGWRQIEYNRDWHDELIMLATKAIDVMQYDFGAVDIIRKGNKLYVLEINTAPGLEPRKLQLYSEYFKQAEEKWRNNEI